jgi:hypothetical protein
MYPNTLTNNNNQLAGGKAVTTSLSMPVNMLMRSKNKPETEGRKFV